MQSYELPVTPTLQSNRDMAHGISGTKYRAMWCYVDYLRFVCVYCFYMSLKMQDTDTVQLYYKFMLCHFVWYYIVSMGLQHLQTLFGC